MKQRIFVLAALILFSAVVLYLSCCEDCPDCPTGPNDEAEEHIFYLGTHEDGPVKVFSVEQKKFIDSFYFEFPVFGTGLDVIGDNEMLVVTHSEGTVIVDLRTRQIIYQFDDWVDFFSSPDSRLFTVRSRSETRLELRRFEDFEVVYWDSLGRRGQFSHDSKYLSYIRFYPELVTAVVTYDIEADSVICESEKYYNGHRLYLWPYYPIISQNKLFFVGDRHLCASDPCSDSVRILKSVLGQELLAFTISPDEKYLYFTNCPSAFGFDMPGYKVYVFDIETEELFAEISTEALLYEPNNMAVTPDGKYLMAGSDQAGSSSCALIDAKNFKAIGVYDFGGPPERPDIPVYVTTKKSSR